MESALGDTWGVCDPYSDNIIIRAQKKEGMSDWDLIVVSATMAKKEHTSIVHEDALDPAPNQDQCLAERRSIRLINLMVRWGNSQIVTRWGFILIRDIVGDKPSTSYYTQHADWPALCLLIRKE